MNPAETPPASKPATSDASGFERGLKIVDVLLKVVGVTVTIMIFMLGQRYTEQQKQIERATTLLKSLASTNPAEVQMAVAVADYLFQRHQLPDDLAPALVALSSNQSPTASNATAVGLDSLVGQIGADDRVPAVTRALVATTLNPTKPRVFIHIRAGANRRLGELASRALQDAGASTPGIQELEFGPDRSELRYFSPADQAEAARLVQVLKGAGVEGVVATNTSQLLRVIRRTVRSGQFELWLAPGKSAGALQHTAPPVPGQ